MDPQADRGTGEPRVPPPPPNLWLVPPNEPVDEPPPVPVWHRREQPPTRHTRPHGRPRES
jgi:hypothetical protein